MYYSAPSRDFLIDTAQPFGVLAKKPFLFGDYDKYRNNKFNLIPQIVQGNIFVKHAVRSKPTLIGHNWLKDLSVIYMNSLNFMIMLHSFLLYLSSILDFFQNLCLKK